MSSAVSSVKINLIMLTIVLLLVLSGCNTSEEFTVTPNIGGKEIEVTKKPPFFYAKEYGHTSTIQVKKGETPCQIIQAAVNNDGVIALIVVYFQEREFRGKLSLFPMSNTSEYGRYYYIFVNKDNQIKFKRISSLTRKIDWVDKNKIQITLDNNKR